MNLKSKAISEIRATILTLTPHPEFADRIEGLQVLLGELKGEQGGKGVPTEQNIKDASKAHYMQYDGEYDSIAVADKAFIEAAQWAISQMQPEWVPIAEYPKNDIPNVMRWHKLYKCPVTVQHRRTYTTDGKEWLSGTMDSTFREDEFEPFFQYLPQPPTK